MENGAIIYFFQQPAQCCFSACASSVDCNDCVLLAEIAFKLNKIKDVKELIDANEDNRLAGMCEFLKQEESRENN